MSRIFIACHFYYNVFITRLAFWSKNKNRLYEIKPRNSIFLNSTQSWKTITGLTIMPQNIG